MKKILFLILICVLPSAFAEKGKGGGDVVNNAGGSAEQNMVYAFQNFSEFAMSCLHSPLCQLSGEERNLLNELQKNAPLELRQSLKFVTAAYLGSQKYQTDAAVGAPILINQEALWKTDGRGYDLADAVELVALALSAHVPQFTLAARMSLAQKISAVAAQQVLVFRMDHYAQTQIQVSVLKSSRVEHVLVEDGADYWLDLESLLQQKLGCPLESLKIFGLSWHNIDTSQIGSDFIQISFSGPIEWTCSGEGNSQRASLTVVFKARPTEMTIQSYMQNPTADRLQIRNEPVRLLLSGASF